MKTRLIVFTIFVIVMTFCFLAVAKAPADVRTIWVDYNDNLETMIKTANFAGVNENFNADRFPIKRRKTGGVEFHLVHFDRDGMTTEDVLRELDSMGLRPAEIAELIAYKPFSGEYHIYALGSKWIDSDGSGYVYYPGIHWSSNCKRYLAMYPQKYHWYKWCYTDRFLAIKK